MKVLVTEATRNASHALIRALADHVEVLGSDHRRLPGGAHSRFTPRYLRTPALTQAGYAEALLDLVAAEGIDIVLPGNQIEPFVRNRDAFLACCRMLIPEYPAWRAAYYNDRTLASCRHLGIGSPLLFEADEALDYLRRQGDHKVMVKPRADVGGGQGLQLHDDAGRLQAALSELDQDAYFIQEYIPGPVGNMRSVALLYDADSRRRMYFTSHKLRQWPLDGGICALGRSTNEPALVDFIEPFFQHWRWQGVAEVELKIDARDGQPKVIEINPRFWGNSNFAVQAGANFALGVCKLLQGEALTQPRYKVGFNYINWVPYLRCVFAGLADKATRGETLRDLRDNLGRPRARNSDIRDWPLSVAKMALEIRGSLRR
jgi:predicted ATP-grasp superfamily ATP-dependent carboligase